MWLINLLKNKRPPEVVALEQHLERALADPEQSRKLVLSIPKATSNGGKNAEIKIGPKTYHVDNNFLFGQK